MELSRMSTYVLVFLYAYAALRPKKALIVGVAAP